MRLIRRKCKVLTSAGGNKSIEPKQCGDSQGHWTTVLLDAEASWCWDLPQPR